MSDSSESKIQDHPPMPETQQSQISVLKQSSNVSFSIWPPTSRTRDSVRNRLIETLSSPSILSKRYGTLTRDEAVETAKLIEDEAFEVAGKASETEDDGIEILQVYSKEISKRMLENVKARSGDSATSPKMTASVKAEEQDLGSTTPPQSEKTDSVAGDD